jgi:hypothetical protein
VKPVEVYCIHCGNPTYKTPRDETHLEELLRHPVGICPICDLKMSLMTDEEVKRHLAECTQEYKDRWEEAVRLIGN